MIIRTIQTNFPLIFYFLYNKKMTPYMKIDTKSFLINSDNLGTKKSLEHYISVLYGHFSNPD